MKHIVVVHYMTFFFSFLPFGTAVESTGDTCTSSRPCVVPGSVCASGVCVCKCGDVYINETTPGTTTSNNRRICRTGSETYYF